MALIPTFTGFYPAHSAIVGNVISVGTGSYYGVIYTTPTGGTTNNYLLNGSRAVFYPPANSTVIFAELILGGYPFTPGTTISFKTPITATTLPYGTIYNSGIWPIYYQDVTSLVNAGGAGTYEVGGVSGDTNCIAWFLYVVYTHPSFPLKYIYYLRGAQTLGAGGTPLFCTLPNIYTPAKGPVQSYMLLASTRDDVGSVGQLNVNSTLIGNPSVGTWNGLAPYNPSNNIHPGVICTADTNDPNLSLLDTRGTFGTANANPYTLTRPNPNRVWAGIVGLDISSAVNNNITSVISVETVAGGGGYYANIRAFEIAAILPPIKSVDKFVAGVGDTLTYTLSFTNSETTPYTNVIFIDTLPEATTFIPNSLLINGTTSTSTLPNINIGTIPVGLTITVSFQARVTNTIPNPASNSAKIIFNVDSATQSIPSNTVSTTINSAYLLTSKLSKAYANIGDTITYTIPIKNLGNTNAFNIHLIDTLPNGTTLVENTLKQDTTPLSGSLNTPGVTLPNPIAVGGTSTITFQVIVFTLPNPNPIPNSATLIFSYTLDNTTTPNIVNTGSTSTNTISTLINRANLSGILKGVNKSFALCNEILTYTITIPNTGNADATNVIFTDTIPPETIYIPDSLEVNGFFVDGTPDSVPIGTIPAGHTSVVTFKVQIIC